MRLILATTALILSAASASADLCTTAATGAGCVVAVASTAPVPLVAIGQTLERGEYSILMNAEYYGLPPVHDGWVYMHIGADVYRVDWRSHAVLENVTEQTAHNF